MIKSIDQAIAELKNDPGKIVTAEVEGLVIELRCARYRTASEVFEEIGPWEGESEEELTRLLRDQTFHDRQIGDLVVVDWLSD